MKKILLTVLVLSSAVFAATFKLDTSHSNISFKVKHMTISNVYGSFGKYDATINYDEKTKALNNLQATIDVNSIDTDNQKRDKHLRAKDFFDAKKYPNIGFKLLSIQGDEAIAQLTIKGITKKISLDFENNGVVKDPWGNTKLGFSMQTKINRKDYGLTWNKVLETGSLVVGDTIKISVDIQAKKIEE